MFSHGFSVSEGATGWAMLSRVGVVVVVVVVVEGFCLVGGTAVDWDERV